MVHCVHKATSVVLCLVQLASVLIAKWHSRCVNSFSATVERFHEHQLNGLAAPEPHCEHILLHSQHKSFMNLFAFKSMLPLKNRQRSCMWCGPTGVENWYHSEGDEEFLLLCTLAWWASHVPEIQLQPYSAHTVSWALDEVFQRVLCSFHLWGQLLDLALCCLTSLPMASCLGEPRAATTPWPSCGTSDRRFLFQQHFQP